MSRLVALLRGVNVGPSNRLVMADLREVLTSLGYFNIQTLLNSGNAVFSGAAGPPTREAERIRLALAARPGIHVRVVVKTGEDIEVIVAENSLTDVASDPSRLIVTFTQEKASLAAVADLEPRDWSPEALAVGHSAVYMWCPNGTIGSKVVQEVGRRLGELGTSRNWTTVEKINTLLRREEP